jgi:hypothetical protein
MRISIFLSLILTCTLFLSGCMLGQQNTDKVNYRTGYDGVELSYSVFPEGDIYVGERFNVAVETWNRGAYDTAPMIVVNWNRGAFESTISGTAFSGIFPQKNVVHGRSMSYPEGEFKTTEILDFHSTGIFLTDQQTFEFIAKACYPYKTEATIEACIGPRTGYRSCNFDELNLGLNLTQGQGAPVAITSVEETIVDSSDGKILPRFNIIIENKQEGQVFRNPEANLVQFCSGQGIKDKVLDRFDYTLRLSTGFVYDSRINNSDARNSFSCSPRIPQLDQEKANITCTLKTPIDAGSYYIAPLVIDVNYGYSDKLTEELTVVSS